MKPLAEDDEMIAENDKQEGRPTLNIVLVGHVDHGKSTLIGRLFYDTDGVSEGRIKAVSQVCEDTGKPFEFAYLLDALEEERDQGITIDTAQARFHTDSRDYVLIDAPGHKEFLKNMVTGASSADAAILLIDAAEGVQEQSRRHGYLLSLLGIGQITVAINKMDLVGYAEDVYKRIQREYLAFLAELNVRPQFVIPVSAREGENLATRSHYMPWYNGPTILEALEGFSARPSRENLPLRFPVQDVYKFDERRIVAGRIEAGVLAAGDEVLFSPCGHRATVKSIERWHGPETGQAKAGESVGITLREPIFVERGQVASHPDAAPLTASHLDARIFWLGKRHLVLGRPYVLKLATQEMPCQVERILEVVDTASLASVTGEREVAKNEVARVKLGLKQRIAFDVFTEIVETGRFVLVDGCDVAGGGVVLPPAQGDYEI